MTLERFVQRGRQAVHADLYEDTAVPHRIKKLELTPPESPQYLLRMCVKAPNTDILLPSMLEWVRPMLNEAIKVQTRMGINHPYCYITVRTGKILSRTDDDWHVDGFSTRITHLPEQNYIWSDTHPTEYVRHAFQVPYSFDPLVHNVNTLLVSQIEDVQVQQLAPKELALLDPYILHRRPPSSNEDPTLKRTFVRISFVPIQINDVNNTQNPLLHQDYTDDGVKFRNNLECKTFEELYEQDVMRGEVF